MTPEELIDREKRRDENEAEALLLLLFLLARQRAVNALRVGADPYAMLAAVLLGSYALGLPGGTARLAAILALADFRGYRRTELLVPGDRFVYRPADYRSTAAIVLSRLLGSLQARVGQGIATARDVSGRVAAVWAAFQSGGFLKGKKAGWQLRRAAATNVGQAYGRGQWFGYERPGLPELAFRHSSVLDSATTEICVPRNNLVLPRTHRYWLTNFPMLHFGCRSVVVPQVAPFDVTPESEIPWSPPPAVGFGRAPFALFNQLTRPAA